jgi:hypothetical protein
MKPSAKSTANLSSRSLSNGGKTQSMAITLTAAGLLALTLILVALFSYAEQPAEVGPRQQQNVRAF